MPSADFTLCVLLYGDYPVLTRRLLGSLEESRPRHVVEVRAGFNYVSPVSASLAREALRRLASMLKCPVRLVQDARDRNVGKYPLMRRMVHGDQGQLAAAPGSHLMWFDDDSYLRGTDPDWWDRAAAVAAGCDLAGSVYRGSSRGQQHLGIMQQAWYAGKPVHRRHRYRFVTGGWWMARLSRLGQWDYPFIELHHNGGDSMLGELARQQGWKVRHYNLGVAVNADENGKESAAPRRGITRTPWPWETIGPSDLRHQDFTVKVENLHVS